MKRLLLAILSMVCGPSWALAQDATAHLYPKFEVFAGYSAIETNNHTFHFRHPNFNVLNTDFDEGGRGFEAAVTRNLTKYFGVMGDFSAYFSHDQGPVNVTGPCVQPPCSAVTQSSEINPRLFGFLAGPEFKWRNHTRVTPFVHALFGVAHSTATFSTNGPAVNLSRTDTDTGFAMKAGAGFDVRIFRHVSFRGFPTYGKAYVGSDALPNQKVNELGWSVGLVFH
jgi:opacity protein-like surface antigen